MVVCQVVGVNADTPFPLPSQPLTFVKNDDDRKYNAMFYRFFLSLLCSKKKKSVRSGQVEVSNRLLVENNFELRQSLWFMSACCSSCQRRNDDDL